MARTVNPLLVKGVVLALVVGGGYFGLEYAKDTGIIPKPPQSVSSVPTMDEMPNIAEPPKFEPQPVREPQPRRRVTAGAGLVCEIWAWQAQTAMIWANGGAQTQPDSAIGRAGGSLSLVRQDDVGQMQRDLVAYAEQYANGNKSPSNGTACVIIMWDGAPAFLHGVNPLLERIGPDYGLKMVGSLGFSRGEDKCMGPPEWKKNPTKAAGGVIAAVLRDGDWNICMEWARTNQVCVNHDETTYDPTCLNWAATSSYTDAAKKYVAKYCEDRTVVDSIETRNVCVSGAAVWTPADVTIAEERGGLVSLASTERYRWQMPSAMLVINKVAQDQRQNIESILEQSFTTAEQITADTSRDLLRKATALNAVVFQEQNGAYWFRYFDVQRVKDITGLEVELGGSSINNLATNLYIMGLVPQPDGRAGMDILRVVYDRFGKLAVDSYPNLMPNFPPYDEVIDRSYVEAIAKRVRPKQEADVPVFQASARVREVVAKRSYAIEFDTGKDTIKPESDPLIKEIVDSAIVAGALMVVVEGHTDNTGNPNGNQSLSEKRAYAVKRRLQQEAPSLFPDARVRVEAYGQFKPLVPNDSPANQAKNRRVEILLGQEG